MVSAKGKEKVSDSGVKGKRKWSAGADDDETGRKRNNRSGALRFFDDAAYEVDKDSDVSDDDDMFDFEPFEEEFPLDPDNNNESGKAAPDSFIPKEEVMSEEEFERMMEGRYKPGAGFVTHAEDTCDHMRLFEGKIYVPSAKDPTIWKVKCMVGRERYSAFCLMQKYVDLKCLGTKLQIISAFAPDHIKGFIFIEADKQSDIYEACKGLCTVYSTKSVPLPNNEMSQLLSVRSKSCGISKGMWARVKSGKYKGDLAMVVAVNDSRKKVTAKLIPRIDLKAMAGKFGGGIAAKRTAIPAQRLISSSELEEFRPLIQYRRDRDTNEMFEFLDGMMLKDGYLYKKIPIDSLNYWGVVPTKDELLKFESSEKDESTDVQWLSQLFGEKKKQRVEDVKQGKGGGKSKGSSSSDVGTSCMHDLVFFGRRDFGVVIGSEKGDSVKVIKEGSEGPSVVTVKQSDLKSASFDKKLFSLLDHHSNTVSINDCVRVLEGPLKDKQGIVKKIYKGILFLCDETEQENDGYICIKGQLCEKVNSSGIASNAKGSEPGSSSFMDLPSSPKSPLSPSKSWQEKDDKSNFKHQENGMFSVGQSLRIRVGPLKGYLCRVLAVRRSDVTVKLDSQKKIITVKCEHLSVVRGRNPAISNGEDSEAVKPFDFLQTQDGASDWMDGATLSTEGNNWNAGGSTERSSWSSLPTPNLSLSNQPGAVVPVAGDAMKEDSGWHIKATSNQSSSWGAVSVGEKTVPDAGPVDGWGTSSGWKQATSSTAVGGVTSASWGKSVEQHHDISNVAEKNESWGKAAEKWSTAGDNCGSKVAWGASDVSSDRQSGGWGDASQKVNKPEASAWKKDKFALPNSAVVDESKWGNQGDTKKDGVENWGKSGSTWGKGRASEPEGPSKKNWEQSKWNLSEKRNNESDSTENQCATIKDDVECWGKSGSTWGKDRESELEGPTKSQEQSQLNFPGKWNDKSASTGNNADIGGFSREWVNLGGANISGNQTKNWDTKMVGGIATEKEQADSWSKPNPVGVDVGPSWKQDSKPSWGKKDDCWGKSSVGNDKESGWKQGSDGNKDTGGGNEWDSSKRDEDDKPSGWNMPNVSNNSGSSDWGKASTGNVDSWSKEKKPDENYKSWTTGNTSFDGQSSDRSSVSQDKAKDVQVGSWTSENNVDGGSSTGWGQSNWLKGQTRDTGGNQGSWSGKSNWNSGNDTDRSNNLDDTGNRGRGGNWRGRGGRGDRGGFRGRGGSGRSGFGGGDSDRGGFESRWGSDRGGIGGRGRSGRDGGFRGRGGYRGRGCGDWKNSGDDLREEKPYSWNKGSNSDSEGWKSSGSRGSWNWGDNENSQGTNQNTSTEWNKLSGNSEMDTWQTKESNKAEGQSGSWGKVVSTSWETASQNEYLRWSKTEPGNENKTKESTKDKEPSDSWGKAVAGSRETAPENACSFGNWNRPEASDGGQTKESAKDIGPSDTWGKAAASSWGDRSSKGGWL